MSHQVSMNQPIPLQSGTILTRPNQTAPLLQLLPDELLLSVLSYLKPAEGRKIRATCIQFNNLLGELLCNSAKIDFVSLQNLANNAMRRLQPPTSTNNYLGRKITVIKSGTINPPSATNYLEAKSITSRLQSFKLYLTYLEAHATSRQKEKVLALGDREAMLAILRTSKQEAESLIQSVQLALEAVYKTQAVANKIFPFLHSPH